MNAPTPWPPVGNTQGRPTTPAPSLPTQASDDDGRETAPLDPGAVKVGAVVTVSADETTTRGPVNDIKYVGGGEWDIWIANHAYPFRAGRIGLWAVTDHQPAPEPEPEWKPGTVYSATVGGVWDVLVARPPIGSHYGDEEQPWAILHHPDPHLRSIWRSDGEVEDVRPLAVIDPATVGPTEALVKAFDDAYYETNSTVGGLRAVLRHLGIEVAR